MFSKTCEYAIRAMIFIARHSTGGSRVGVKEIAEGIDSPVHFIAKILQELVRHNIVQSAKGPSGGFYVDSQSLDCTLADIVVAIDGPKLLMGCGLGLKECSENQPCPIHFEFKKIRQDIYNLLKSTKLSEFQHDTELSVFYLRR